MSARSDCAAPDEEVPRRLRVLIVDDAEGMRAYLATLFEIRGFDVDTCDDGARALSLLENGADPDLLLLDVMMPGTDGLAALARIREAWPELPVLMVSVVGKAGTIVQAMQLGAADYLTKPFEEAELDAALDRLGLQAHLALSDAADVKRWWDGEPFDRILIDAPCSGTGVIRRHPDIKWLRRDTDIPPLVLTQRRLLDRLGPLLKPDGVLVYATCSVLRAEGDAGIKTFLQRTPDARPAAVSAPVGLAERCGLRIPPGGDFDGFYYARLTRRGNLPVTGVR